MTLDDIRESLRRKADNVRKCEEKTKRAVANLEKVKAAFRASIDGLPSFVRKRLEDELRATHPELFE